MSVDLAVKNVRERIEENPYPGRGIVLGRSGDGAWVQVYWIMGRSDNSRNRIFVCEDGVVRTEAADPSNCLLYTSPSPRDKRQSRMPSSA